MWCLLLILILLIIIFNYKEGFNISKVRKDINYYNDCQSPTELDGDIMDLTELKSSIDKYMIEHNIYMLS